MAMARSERSGSLELSAQSSAIRKRQRREERSGRVGGRALDALISGMARAEQAAGGRAGGQTGEAPQIRMKAQMGERQLPVLPLWPPGMSRMQCAAQLGTFALHFRVVGARPDRRVERERLLQITRLARPQTARTDRQTD